MSMFFMTTGFILACPALYLIGDFLFWLIKGRAVRAKITGFQEKTNKRMPLPLVLYRDERGNLQNARVERIDRLLYLLNRSQAGDFTTIIYRKDIPHRARVYGYINVVGALILSLPLLAAAALRTGASLILGQAAYIAVFGVIAIGGWIFLKLIQRS